MERRTDEQVLADVKAALRDAPVDELAVDATVHEGVVTLRGRLSSYSERLAAMTAAKKVAGHARVTSELTVAPVGQGYRMSDSDIALEVARALIQADVAPGTITFSVKNRIVLLEGRASSGAERARIRHEVQNAPGVHFIDNRITVGAFAPSAP